MPVVLELIMDEKAGASINPGESTVSTEVVPPTKKSTRREWGKRALAFGVALVAGLRPKPVDAQLFPTSPPGIEPTQPAVVKPETPRPADSLQSKDSDRGSTEPTERVKQLVKSASHFLDGDTIQLNVLPKGIKTSVTAKYHPRVVENTITDPSIMIRVATEEDQPMALTDLQIGEKVGEIIGAKRGNYLFEKFQEAFSEHAKIDLKLISESKGSADQLAVLNQFKAFFELSSFVNGAKKEEEFGSLKNIKKDLFSKTMAIWLLQSDKLVDKLKTLTGINQVAMANIFAKTLRHAMDTVSSQTAWEDLGINKNAVYDVIALSKNDQLKKYFDEKIAYMKK